MTEEPLAKVELARRKLVERRRLIVEQLASGGSPDLIDDLEKIQRGIELLNELMEEEEELAIEGDEAE
jgi:hypothetical protein